MPRRIFAVLIPLIALAVLALESPGAKAQGVSSCMEKYLQELDGAAKLVKPDGNMADYYRKRKSLYMEYFYLSELSARMMVDNQRYVDIWEAYERGIVDIQQALQKSKELQDQMKASEPYDSRTFICRGAHLN